MVNVGKYTSPMDGMGTIDFPALNCHAAGRLEVLISLIFIVSTQEKQKLRHLGSTIHHFHRLTIVDTFCCDIA